MMKREENNKGNEEEPDDDNDVVKAKEAKLEEHDDEEKNDNKVDVAARAQQHEVGMTMNAIKKIDDGNNLNDEAEKKKNMATAAVAVAAAAPSTKRILSLKGCGSSMPPNSHISFQRQPFNGSVKLINLGSFSREELYKAREQQAAAAAAAAAAAKKASTSSTTTIIADDTTTTASMSTTTTAAAALPPIYVNSYRIEMAKQQFEMATKRQRLDSENHNRSKL